MSGARLESLVASARQRVTWSAGLSLWTNCYTYITILLPSLLTAPRYFAGEVEFGVITQVSCTASAAVAKADAQFSVCQTDSVLE